MTTLKGIDVSEFQGYVDWNKVRRQYGASFSMAKATQGTYERDRTFPHNWVSMKYRGVRRGAYHYYDYRYDPVAQADFLHGYVRDSGRFERGDYVCLDVEEMFGVEGSPAWDQEQIARFITRCREQINKQVVIYSGYYFLQFTVGPVTHPVLRSCPLHIASYGAEPICPSGWDVISFWQDSCTASVPGVVGQCDTDKFFGNESQLKKVLGV